MRSPKNHLRKHQSPPPVPVVNYVPPPARPVSAKTKALLLAVDKLQASRARAARQRANTTPKHKTPNWQFPKGPAQTPANPNSNRTRKRLALRQYVKGVS